MGVEVVKAPLGKPTEIPASQNGHGEICDSCMPVLVAMQNTNQGLEQTLRMQAAKLGRYERERDPETKAKEHARWQEVADLFELWRVHCKHPRSRFSAKRFQVALPYVDAHGVELCRRAVEGAAYDPFVTKRKNGSPKRHDGWELIFRDDQHFEEFCNKAPR